MQTHPIAIPVPSILGAPCSLAIWNSRGGICLGCWRGYCQAI